MQVSARTTGTGQALQILGEASHREPMTPADGKSSATFERIVVDGQRYVVKVLDVRRDWIARATGDYGPRVVALWRSGLFDRLPDCLDHAIVDVALDPHTRAATILMRDMTEHLVPEGDEQIPLVQHRRFLDHMAALHAAFWGWEDTVPLAPMPVRYTMLSPRTGLFEAQRGDSAGVPETLPRCWATLHAAVPEAAALARWLATEPWPLIEALSQTPATFVHGDWKAGNLGSLPGGRTVLLDWGTWAGRAAPCVDLAWYLGVNCDRLPESKEQAIAAYRESLERRGIATDGWWDRQLELGLLGGFVQLGWSKTGDPDELAWWAGRAMRAARLLA